MQVSLFAFVLPLMTLLLLCSYEIFILVLGEKWLSSVVYFQIMCVAGITLPLHPLCTSTLKVFGKAKLLFRLEVVKKVLIVILIVLTFNYGVIGLVWGQLAFFWIALAMNMYYGGKQINYTLSRQVLDILPYMGVVLFSYLLAYGASFIFDNLYIITLLRIGVFTITYTISLYVFRLPESEIITNLINRKV